MGAETMKKTKKPFSMKKWVKSRNGQQTIVILSFMIIPLLLLFVFTYLPFGEMVKFSFYKMKYATPVDKRQFVGFRNYIDVFKKDECFSALKLSLYYMAGAMVQLVLALYLATILSFKTKFGNMFKGFMFFPYLISGIAIGFIFKFFYTRGFVFDTVLQWCGFNLESLPFWLKDKSVNNISLVASSVWRYYGNNMVLFIGAIMSVDSEMYEAAELDGANKFQQFIHIILPSIKTIVTLNVDPVYHRFPECFRSSLRYHQGWRRNRNLLRIDGQDRTYQPAGRSGVCYGGGTVTDHFCSNNFTKAFLQTGI